MKSKVQMGLEIFAEAWGAYDLTAAPGQVLVFPNAEEPVRGDWLGRIAAQEELEAQIVGVIRDQLEALGWFKEEDMGWSHYV